MRNLSLAPDEVTSERSLRVLGCDGSWPSPCGANSGYLVEVGDGAEAVKILVDAGTGTFAQLQRYCDPSELDAVILTHEHPDHCSDIEGLSVWVGYGPGRAHFGAERKLAVYAPVGLRELTYHAKEIEGLEWRTLADGAALSFGWVSVRCSRTDHPVETYGLCFSHRGSTLVYSADTGPKWSPRSFGRAVGTFLCEATYESRLEGVYEHLSGREAGVMAREARAGTLILTHRKPSVPAEVLLAEARGEFSGPILQAELGAAYPW